MKLISLQHRYDFGHDWYVQLLHTSRWAVLQVSFSWNDFASWPYIQIKSGTGDLIDILFWVYKFGLCINFLGRAWNWNHLDQIYDEDHQEIGNEV